MTRSLIIFLTITAVLGVRAQESLPVPAHGPKVSFNKEVYDYDTIPFAGDGRCEFIMTNVGDEPLIISNFQSSCGCLVPYYEREPILPGKSSVLRARYDTNRPGPFTKSLTLTTNAVDRPVVVLRIKGVVRFNAVGVLPGQVSSAPER